MNKEILAENIKQTSLWHKENCKDDNCKVSLVLLGLAYSEILDRELTSEEMNKYFHF